MDGLSRPGKTAPLFADDVRRYDPRHPPSTNFNLLADIPPIRPDFELVSPTSCAHQYILKSRQSFTPDGNEAMNTEYCVSAVCALCRLHLDLSVTYPTPWGHHGPFPHHLIYIPDAAHNTLKMDKNPFRKDRPARQEFHFQSTYSQYPLHVTVKYMEPLLTDEQVKVLTSVQRQEERTEAARQSNPDKFLGLEMPSVKKTIGILRKYIENIIQEDNRGKLINGHGKTFSMSFGPRGETVKDIFEFIGFKYIQVEEGEGDCYLQAPETSASSTAPLQDPLLIFLDNISSELFALQLSRPDTEQGLYAAELFEWASAHMNRLLGINIHVPRDLTWTWVNFDPMYGQSRDFRYFYDLGVIRTAPTEHIIEAYHRQIACDPDRQRRMYYMRCLCKIGETLAVNGDYRVSTALQEEYQKNKYTDDDLTQAFEVFGFQTFDDTTPSADAVITAYKQKLRSNPAALDSFRPFLQRIGDYKHSSAIMDIANMPFPTYEKALDFFNVDKNTQDDFIISMFTTKLLDNSSPESLSLAREALDVIAEERNSILLTEYLKTGEIRETEMDVNKALALLQSPPEADDSSIMAAYASCCIDNPERKAEFEKALDIISKDRGRDVRVSERDPDLQPQALITAPQPGKGNAEWPVGLYNIANTCYLNSLLQFYFTITPFREMILNYPEYLTDLDRESIKKKRVGMRYVMKEEVKRSQRWMKKMSELFNEMITSPYAALTPTKNLAALTLYRSSLDYANARRDSIASPKLPPAPAITSLGKIEGVPIAGPLGPPIEETEHGYDVKDDSQKETAEVADVMNDVARNSIDTEATVVPTEGQIDDPEASTEKLVPKPEATCADDDDVTMTEHAEVVENQDVSSSNVEERPASPTAVPQISTEQSSETQYAVEPPSRDPPDVPEKDEDAEIPLEYGAQQDVTEVISNFMFQAQCAIKPEGFAPDGEQEDLVKSLFYGKTKTFIHTPKGVRSQEELFNDIKVNVASGPQSIYNALDYAHDFQTVSLEDGEVEQYATLSRIPPILQIQVQRVQYDLEKQQAFKSNNHLELKETIYMDRYKDSEDNKIIERRRKVKEWKSKIEALDARRKQLIEFSQGASVLDTLNAAKEKIRSLETLNNDPLFANEAIEVPDSTVTDISDLEVRIRDEITAIDGQKTQIQDLIDREFDDMQELAYRLYAVFIHSGQVSYGHYWIYIFDFDRKIWRKYNDDYVTEVTDISEIYKEDPRGIASPYFVVYVKDDLKQELVQPVVRDPVPIEEPTPVLPVATDKIQSPDEIITDQSSRNPSDQSSEGKTTATSMTESEPDTARQRGRSPPPSYDDITSAGTQSQHHVEYSYAPSQCFYQDDVRGATAARSPAPVLLEPGSSQPASVSDLKPDYGNARVVALSTAANLDHGASPAVSSTSSKSSSNPFRQEPGTIKAMTGMSPDTAIFGSSTNEEAAPGAGTGIEADVEWWHDDSGSK
ncbi:hypothetical protein KEM56_007841 [Ascosphaera pollenicola]|nr:hypothetical protein KEM56_007841 [Ascosphaera pollenicola]